MSAPFEIGHEVRDRLEPGRAGVVMDLFADNHVMVLWDDEMFCRLVPESWLVPATETVDEPESTDTWLIPVVALLVIVYVVFALAVS